MVHKLENEKERDIIIDRRFYKAIIGSKGEKIKEVREKFNQVQITIPGPGKIIPRIAILNVLNALHVMTPWVIRLYMIS